MKIKQSETLLTKIEIYDSLNDPDYLLFKNEKNFTQVFNKFALKESKSISCFLSAAVADALGCQIEFQKFNLNSIIMKTGWQDIENYCKQNNYQRAQFGQFSDDTSMAHCLADSLLSNNFKLVEKDLMYRFILWWYFGYNNGSKDWCLASFGLGGNIKNGLDRFLSNENKFKYEYFKFDNGNGSIMRLAPLASLYYDNEKICMDLAARQSLVTHNGKEAYECCRLLALILCKLINYNGKNPKQDILDKIGEQFTLEQQDCQSVWYLAYSQTEPEDNLSQYSKQFNKKIDDRNWDWKSKNFVISPTRYKENANYYGSYVMDCMKIALHIVYNTDSLVEAIFKAVDFGGDCDTFGSVVGQIAGAMYGLDENVLKLYNEKMIQFENYATIVKAYKLFHKKAVQTDFKLQ